MPGKVADITAEQAESIKVFIRESVAATGASKAVVGLSGGIDSAVVAKLCVDALGPERVVCIFMPSSGTPKEDYGITEDLAGSWGVEYRAMDISQAVSDLDELLGGDLSPMDKGNLSARCRMTVLFSVARQLGGVVMGTSNRSEYMMGYFTKYGDGASDIAPLVCLYKTQVWQLARIIGVPDEIISRPPSAGLWDGQTDESDMGITYAELDPVLHYLESGMDIESISGETGLSVDRILAVRRRMDSMSHKRALPVRPE